MDTSIFGEKEIVPDETMLRFALGDSYELWSKIRAYISEVYPLGQEEWNFPGQKYGWSFRIKDKKRAIIYMLPRDRYFLVAFVFGEKAVKAALESRIAGEIREIINSARVYAEGRGFRIEVKDDSVLEDIKRLIDIKLA